VFNNLEELRGFVNEELDRHYGEYQSCVAGSGQLRARKEEAVNIPDGKARR
jgi:hypothetical protein